MLIQVIVEIRHKAKWTHYATLEECAEHETRDILVQDLIGRMLPKSHNSTLEMRTRWVILHPRGDHTVPHANQKEVFNEFWFVPYLVAPREPFWRKRWTNYDPALSTHTTLEENH